MELTATGRALVSGVIESPGDDTRRLVLADWMDENNMPREAARLRTIRREKFARLIHQGWLQRAIYGERVTIPEVIREFVMYRLREPVWGALHVVLDDNNIDNNSVTWCLHNSCVGHEEATTLAIYLIGMTLTQRGKIDNVVRHICDFDNSATYRPGATSTAEIEWRCLHYREYMDRFARMRRARKK